MNAKRKMRSVLAILLVVAMLLPNVVSANDFLKDEGAGKATFSLVYLESADDSDFPYTKIDPKTDLKAGDKFYVGLLVSNLSNVTEISQSLFNISCAIVYDNRYIQLEPDAGRLSTDTVVDCLKNNLNYAGSLTKSLFAYSVSSYNMNLGSYTAQGYTADDRALVFNVKYAGADPDAPEYNYSEFKEDEFYAAIVQVGVKEVPESGLEVLDFQDQNLGGAIHLTIDFGNSEMSGCESTHYEWNESRPTFNMGEIVELDTSGVDIFPVQYSFKYDANLTNTDNVALNIDSNTVTPDLSTANTGTALKGDKLTAAMNLVVSAKTADTPAKNVAVSGWYTDTACTNAVDFATGTMTNALADLADENGVITLYAKWANANIITLDGNGGTATEGGSVSYAVPEGSGITLDNQGKTVPNFARENYSIEGWYKATGTNYDPTTDTKIGNDSAAVLAEPITDTETWYVNWESTTPDNTITVNFDGNADGITVSPDSVTVNKNDYINSADQGPTGYNMPAPTRTNYTFDGWNTAANGTGTDFDGRTQVTDSLLNTDTNDDGTNDAVTVYAQWKVTSTDPDEKWTIDFHAYGDANAPLTVNPAQVEVDATAGAVTVAAAQMPNDPVWEGHALVGWYEATLTDGIYTPDLSAEYKIGSTINKDMDVVAVFGVKTTTTLHLQDKDPETTWEVDGLVDDLISDWIKTEKSYADVNAFAANVKPNYEFKGWGTVEQTMANKDTETVVSYADAALATDKTDLYAWWTVNIAIDKAAATYTGSALKWNDILKPSYVTFDEDEVPVYTSATDLELDTDYTLKVWAGTDTTGTPIDLDTGIVNAGTYSYEFTSTNPEVVFTVSTGTFFVNKAKIQIEVNDGAMKSDEDADVQILPNITIKIGDETLSSTSEDADERTRVENILKDLGVKYVPLTKNDEKNYADAGTTIENTDVNESIRNDVVNNPYKASEYVVVIQPKADANYEVDKDNSTGGLTTGKITGNLGINYSDTDDFAFLTTVEANSRTVTFQNVDNMTDKNLTTIGTPVVVKNGAKINDVLEEGETTKIPDHNTIKPDNYEFVGWYIMPASMTTYDQLAADVNGTTPTATEFTAETVIDANMTVVAVWKTSTDAGLKDSDPDDPDNPDYVGGLQLSKKDSTDTTAEFEAITKLYASDYTTEKPFKAVQTGEGADNNYYVRLDNKYDLLKIKLVTNEPGAAIAVTKYADGTAVPADTDVGNNIELTANESDEITLNVAVDGKANIFKIEVTAPDTTTKNTYYVFVQRMNVARIELNYGNSPYGLIMADDAITDKAVAKQAFVDGGYQFSADYMPAKGVAGTTYVAEAWGEGTNIDMDDYAMFLYNEESFRDPGFTAIDSLGNKIDATNVTRTITVERMNKDLLNGLDGDNVEADTVVITGEDVDYVVTEVTSSEKLLIRPNLYTMTYSFADPMDPTGDPIEATRYVVILNMCGDADNSGSLTSGDKAAIVSFLGGRTFANYSDIGQNIFKFRVMDTDMTGSITSGDGNKITNILGGGANVRFYTALT